MKRDSISQVQLWTDWRLFEGETAAGAVYSFSQQFPPYGIYVNVSIREEDKGYEVWSIAEHRTSGPYEDLIETLKTLEKALVVAEQQLRDWEKHLLGTVEFYNINQKYGCFSNFARYPITLKGKVWPTSEHYFQAQKFAGTEFEEEIRLANSPKVAAQMGRDRNKPLRSDWETVKDSVMREAVSAKFDQHPELREKLLSTGDSVLIEHTKNDSYWGDGGNGQGKNMLGRILMGVRAELREAN